MRRSFPSNKSSIYLLSTRGRGILLYLCHYYFIFDTKNASLRIVLGFLCACCVRVVCVSHVVCVLRVCCVRVACMLRVCWALVAYSLCACYVVVSCVVRACCILCCVACDCLHVVNCAMRAGSGALRELRSALCYNIYLDNVYFYNPA